MFESVESFITGILEIYFSNKTKINNITKKTYNEFYLGSRIQKYDFPYVRIDIACTTLSNFNIVLSSETHYIKLPEEFIDGNIKYINVDEVIIEPVNAYKHDMTYYKVVRIDIL